MNESLNICLSCGLCCNGTMIGFVQIEREELPVLGELMNIEEANGAGFFFQPCDKYSNGCTIYSQRSKQCASFKCGLLKLFEQMELDFDSAIDVIDVVKQKRIAIEEKLDILQLELKSKSFFFKMVELKMLMRKDKSKSFLTQNHRELISNLKQLDKLLLIYFGVS